MLVFHAAVSAHAAVRMPSTRFLASQPPLLQSSVRRRITLACEPDSCPLPPSTFGDKTLRKLEANDNEIFDVALALLPFVPPVFAFNLYDDVLSLITWAIDNAPGNWVAVDGGKAQVELLTPTINGVILPAISIALGTLSATTISSLRDRQIALRE